MEEIILYTTHCPMCLMLEQKLKEKNIKFKEETNSTHLKLTSNSYVWFGNDDPVATGYDVIADDIFIFDGSVDFSKVSTDYIDTKHEKRCLYIDSETGQVYGYRKD